MSRHRHRLAAVLVLLLVLLCPPPPCAADPDDERCLSHLHESFTSASAGGGGATGLLNWTKPAISAPCEGFTSRLQGVTCNNGRVYKLSLPGLALGGAIPPELSNCTNLQTLDLSANALSGAIPPQLSGLLNLAVLNLSANALDGAIPRDLAACAYLNVIDLHANRLTGPIPDELGLLVRLSAFDVSYNRLSGPVPVLLANRTGGAPRFNASSFVGNKGLYGYPLPPRRTRGLSVLAIVGIGLGSGLLSLVLSFSAVCLWLRATDRTASATTPGGDEGKISHLMPDY
ncbi:hypothetical protein U9M48_013922 [Paspalum notatum var. saurae]|uniref:Leucine-rich repeat-containing N-terminal plant-type domain-containing protein n=1 Tax=Paspalum notatum var. saurae TaxID=547442 RepID=A0AAQ3T0I7_PASNO